MNQIMHTGQYYQIIANSETQKYDVVSIATGFVEYVAPNLPQARITLEEFERRLAQWAQQKDREDVVVTFPSR